MKENFNVYTTKRIPWLISNDDENLKITVDMTKYAKSIGTTYYDEFGCTHLIIENGTPYPTNDGNVQGVVFEDVSEKDGHYIGSLLIKGCVYEERLSFVGSNLSSTAKEKLNNLGVKVFKAPIMLQPGFVETSSLVSGFNIKAKDYLTLKIESVLSNDLKCVVNIDGKDKTYVISGEKENNYYAFDFINIVPHAIMKPISITIQGLDTVPYKTDSMYAYLLKTYEITNNQKLKDVIANFVNYGKLSYKYLYNGDIIPIAPFTPNTSFTAPVDDKSSKFTTAPDGTTLRILGVSLLYNFDFKLSFTMNKNAYYKVVDEDGKEVTNPTQKIEGSSYDSVIVGNIKPNELDKKFKLIIYSDEAKETEADWYSISPNGYIARINKLGSNEDEKKVMMSIYYYGAAYKVLKGN